jgi:hypothetical protein
METRERPPPMSETSMAGPLQGTDGDPGAPTFYVGEVDDGPPREAMMKIRERPTFNAKKKHRRQPPRPPWGVWPPSGI